jgi:hypothetical protein
VLTFSLASCVRFASELDVLDRERGELDPAPAGKDWSCAAGSRGAPLSDSSLAPAAEDVALEGLQLALPVVDFVTAAPVEALRARACYRVDVDCASPISEAKGDGHLQIGADAGFNGYLEIEAPGMVPTLLFFSEPWSSQLLAQLEGKPVRLLPLPSLRALGNTAHLELDPAGGVLGVYAYDCAGTAAPGVRLELDTDAVAYSFVDELPVINQDVTSEQGLAGFVNVPPGVVVVSTFAAGQPEALSVESFLVRGGWLSSMSLLPGSAR